MSVLPLDSSAGADRADLNPLPRAFVTLAQQLEMIQ
jgi:hypothetical protein